MNISILINKNSWANNYKKYIKFRLSKFAKKICFINNHKKIGRNSYVNIIFSYFHLIERKYLDTARYNIVPHGSDLPKGKGMSPITWQILEGKKEITFSLFEASNEIDNGNIYLKKKIKIPEYFLFKEIKELQLKTNLDLIEIFLKKLIKNKSLKAKKQKGKSTFYKKRDSLDQEIDINKSLKSQINLLRTSDNRFYPPFFKYKNKKFKITIEKL